MGSLHSGVMNCPIEHAPRRTNEGMARQILVVSWLLADEHQPRRSGASFTRHDVGCIAVERTTRAFGLRLAQSGERLDRCGFGQ